MPRKRPASSNELLPTVKVDDAENAAQIADQAARLAEFVAKALIVAQQLGIQKKPLKPFRLTPDHRGFLFEVPEIPPAIKAKFKNAKAKFTFCEVADMAMALAEAATGREPKRQIPCL